MSLEPHEIPTHLDTPDRAFFGLTLRQIMVLSVALGSVFAVIDSLGMPLAVPAALFCAVSGLLVAFVQPLGRPFEEWLFVMLRYAATPRRATWRPRAQRAAAGRQRHEVDISASREAP